MFKRREIKMVPISKRFFSILTGVFTGIVILLAHPVFAAEVPFTKAEEVALNFITYLGENYTVSKIEPLEEAGETIGYLANLDPQGYILVAGDTIRVPVKAYSLTSNFDSLPPAYVKVLLNELKILASSNTRLSKSNAAVQPEDTNRSYWDFLTQAHIVSRKSLRSYTPDTFLLTTKWNQGYPYNKFNPKVGDELTVTGCTQTALAQLMRYHAYPSSGSGVVEHLWNGQTLTAVMNRPFNWSIMPDSVNGSAPQYQQDEVAALMRDLGVLNEAEFGTYEMGGTSAYFHTDQFERAFGYVPVLRISSDNSNFFSTITNEINNSRPMLLSLPGHLTVADGYSSDGSGKKIHVNLGWGGASDDYYYLDQTIITENYSFPPDNTIYYNIRPCQSGECNPYTPAESGTPPVIGSSYQNGMISDLNDIVIEGSETIRIEVYDPDGDTVTLTVSSSCNSLQTALSGNLLTLTPTANNIFCEVTLTAESNDGLTEKTFRVLALENRIYIGNQYDIGGQFADGTEIDEYKAYLEGYTTISGYRGFSNQGFYIWVKDKNGNIIIQASDEAVAGSFTAGLYTISASLKKLSAGSYYNYYADFSAYNLTVTCNSLNADVSDLAESMGIELSDDSSTSIIAPTVETGSATLITNTSAILNGTINSNGSASTYYFEYGTSGSYGFGTALQNAGSGTVNTQVATNLTDLAPGTTYHFRIVATNVAGVANGDDQTFKTDSPELPENVTSYQILTDQSSSLTVSYGDYIRVVGSNTGNIITLESGARVECINFIGANVVNFEESSFDFMVYRSGATVYLQSASTGTMIKIAATSTIQTLNFSDKTLALVISEGKIRIGTQEITTAQTEL